LNSIELLNISYKPSVWLCFFI